MVEMIEGRIEWRDLSGVELRRRLTQRGIEDALANHLVTRRESAQEFEIIEGILNANLRP